MGENKKIRPRVILAMAVLYSMAHFLLILGRGFWSDGFHLITLLQEHNYGQLWVHLGPFKSYALYYLIKFFVLLGGNIVILIKLAGFLNWFVSGIVLYVIIRKFVGFPERDGFFISSCFMLFASFPFKGELAYLHFSIDTMVFFLAALLCLAAENSKRTWTRFAGLSLSLVLFFVSFTTNSILVFYWGFIAFQFCKAYKMSPEPPIAFFVSWLKKNFFFVALPFAYWFFQAGLGKPYGELGAHYNEFVIFKPGFLRIYFDNVWNYIAYGFFWPIVGPVVILQRRIFVALLAVVLAVIHFSTRRIYSRANADSQDVLTPELPVKPYQYVLWGILWFGLAAFPYLAVGDYPTIFGDGFHMRYGLLLSLGSSLIVLGFILAVVREKWQSKVQAIILGAFVVFNIYNYYTLDMDWYRQQAVIFSLKETKSEAIKNASTLVFYDDYGEHKFLGRAIKTSEYGLYLHRALFPNGFKFALAIQDVDSNDSVPVAIVKAYGRFSRTGIWPHPESFDPLAKVLDVAVVSNASHETMTVREWLTLKKYELFSNEATFLNKIKSDLQIEVAPIEPRKII